VRIRTKGEPGRNRPARKKSVSSASEKNEESSYYAAKDKVIPGSKVLRKVRRNSVRKKEGKAVRVPRRFTPPRGKKNIGKLNS